MSKISTLAERAKALKEQQQTLVIAKNSEKIKKKKRAQVFLEDEVKKELQLIGIHTDKTEQALMIEALNLLFEAYGKTAIAR